MERYIKSWFSGNGEKFCDIFWGTPICKLSSANKIPAEGVKPDECKGCNKKFIKIISKLQ